MPTTLPHLRLTLGQVAWVLSQGQVPTQRTLDQLRYLRQLGVPFGDEQGGSKPGSGVRAMYSYDHMVEMGVALFAVQRGMRPQDAARFLINERPTLRQLFRKAFLQLPNEVLANPDLRTLRSDDINIRIHDRYSDRTGEIDMVDPEEIPPGLELGDYVERYPDGRSYPLVPVSRLVVQWVQLALNAPPSKRGREA